MEVNTPYVKKYVDGILQNPINGQYINKGQNRASRRMKLDRSFNNRGKNTVVVHSVGDKTYAYKAIIQKLLDRCIVHYQSKTSRKYSTPNT